MTDIASGRATMLQKKIVESVIRAHDIDGLSAGKIRHIFKDLLDDPTIKVLYWEKRRSVLLSQGQKAWMREKEEDIMYNKKRK